MSIDEDLKPYQPGSITIVSGLPRSGTSMVMQMLEAGGIGILQDQIRLPDNDNPKGYYEFERVKHLKNDTTWLNDAGGKAIKVIYALLSHLPEKIQYNLLFVSRDLDEILISQTKMLNRLGKRGAGTDPDTLKSIFQKEVDKTQDWLLTQPHFRILKLQHHNMIENPMEAAEKINFFLGGNLNVQAMQGAIDPTLYRNRNPKGD